MKKGKKVFIILSICFILFLSCIYTNPSKIDYTNWATETIQQESSSILEKGLISLLGKKLISDSTLTKNYVICSVYKTQIENDKLVTLGIFKNFIPLKKDVKKGAN